MMSSGGADFLSIAETVQLFLGNILDQVVTGANEYDSENIRNIVEEILETVTAKIDWVLREQELGAACRKVIHTTTDVQRNDHASSKREQKALGAISGIKNTTIWTEPRISGVSKVANQVENSNVIFGLCQDHIIQSPQSEIYKAVQIKKSEAFQKKKANELNGKAFPNFSKLQDVKIKNGKVKVFYCEDLSKEEQGRLQKEAEELFRRIGEAEKQKMKQRREAEGRKKGFGSRLRRFFRKFSCCRSSADE